MEANVAAQVHALNGVLPDNVRVHEPLAAGGQGFVFRGSVDGIAAAVKLYRHDQTETRVDREIEALARLDTKAIARLLWSGNVGLSATPTRVVATRLVDGTPLDTLLRHRALTEAELHALLFDVSDAIRHLWDIRLVHRDLKPGNIIISGGRAVVIDLGLARHVDQTSLTISGSTWGTVGYMSPEQARAVKQLTCKSDIFALGVIALECVLQRHPTGRDQRRLLTADLHETLPCVLPPTCSQLVQRMLAPRPTQRPTPDVVLTCLSTFAQG